MLFQKSSDWLKRAQGWMRFEVLRQLRMPQQYVIIEITYGSIKAVLRMKKNGIEGNDIKKIKKSFVGELQE